jgi:hypothetical protein
MFADENIRERFFLGKERLPSPRACYPRQIGAFGEINKRRGHYRLFTPETMQRQRLSNIFNGC